MRQKLLAVAVSGALAALATPASFAQSTATISGTISVGIHATGATGAAGDPNVTSLGGGANAINISTLEDLGGGLRGGFTGQIRFNAATGDRNSAGTGNALMHAANVFLTGGFGTFRVGKIGEASNCGFDPWACTGGASLVAGSTAGHNALIAGLTTANAVNFTTPTVSGFSGSYQTSMSIRVNERRVLSLDYAQGPLALQYLQSNNSANTAADGAVGAAETIAAITDVKGKGTSLGASYNMGFARVNFINAVTKNAAQAKTANITSISGSVPMGALTWLAGYNKARTGGDYTATVQSDTKFSVGVNYALSKRTTVGADIMNAEAANGSTGFTLRARHTF